MFSGHRGLGDWPLPETILRVRGRESTEEASTQEDFDLGYPPRR